MKDGSSNDHEFTYGSPACGHANHGNADDTDRRRCGWVAELVRHGSPSQDALGQKEETTRRRYHMTKVMKVNGPLIDHVGGVAMKATREFGKGALWGMKPNRLARADILLYNSRKGLDCFID